MTPPMTPREKVAVFDPCPGCGADEPRNRCLGCRHDFAPNNRQEILDGSTVTALASGSGDHAELARLAEMADWMAAGDLVAEGSVLLAASVAAEHSADLKSLLAENAALRANEKAALKECSEWARKAGEAIGKLEASEAAGIVEGWRDRATEAERKLAEAVGLLKEYVFQIETPELLDEARTFLNKEAERG